MTRWVLRGVVIATGAVLIATGSSTRTFGVALVVAGVLSAILFETARSRGSLAPQEFVRTYDASREETFAALRSAVEQLRYRVRSADEATVEMAFNTGMSGKTWAGQDFTAVVHEQQTGKSELRLVGATSRGGLGAIQSVSWGETEKLGNRVLDRTYQALQDRA